MPSNAKAKTKQILAYIIKHSKDTSVTGLMKISYIIDLVAIKKGMTQLTNFKYVRFNYGPFDKSIYAYVKQLVDEAAIVEDSVLSDTGDEFIVYNYSKKNGFVFDRIEEEEIEVINEVLSSVKAYGAKALTELAYRTKPMKSLGARIGNKRGLNQPLNLTT